MLLELHILTKQNRVLITFQHAQGLTCGGVEIHEEGDDGALAPATGPNQRYHSPWHQLHGELRQHCRRTPRILERHLWQPKYQFCTPCVLIANQVAIPLFLIKHSC